MNRLPELLKGLPALSVRQPWAWLISNGYKDIENRNWSTMRRGPILIHASKGMTLSEYADCWDLTRRIRPDIGHLFPEYEQLERGGIVGCTAIVDCVSNHASGWFFGDYGFVLKDSYPIPFIPCRGQLGFFTPEVAA